MISKKMQHIPSTVEEQLFLRAFKEECPWQNLPKRLQAIFNSKDEWHRSIIDHCIKKRLQWNTSFACKVCKENEYYDEMMRFLRKSLALFPYYLAEYVCRVMRVSPFRYYCDMIFDLMRNEQPYDSIPNFSAADALRLTGIGRNEFIDIMNQCKSKKIMWKLNKSIAKELLPTQPVDFSIEPWWCICLVKFTVEEFKKLSEDEKAMVNKICREEANAFVHFDPDIIKALYRRGLVYFEVPVYPDDRIKVFRLEGFISNKEQSYEDPIEELLYAVFVVSSEHATIAELASTLQADLRILQAAASFVCRLGWAQKVIDPAYVLQENTMVPHGVTLTDEEGSSRRSSTSANVSIDGGDIALQGDFWGTENYASRSCDARVAFVVDANITSYLMMGSVSPGLKSHAVTLYEAGKLGHASIADLCKDLSTLEGTKFEGVLQEFANHAYSLRCVLECLLSGGVAADTRATEVVDRIRMPTSGYDESSAVADVSLTELSEQSSSNEAEQNVTGNNNLETSQEDSLFDNSALETAGDDESATLSEDGKFSSEVSKSDLKINVHNGGKAIHTEGSDVGKGTPRKRKKYRVDILRCESLASLPKATLDRLFLRDYDIILSIIPLPHSCVLPGPAGPIHFGPPSHSSMTPWMKLVLYSTVASGPLSVVLMKGLCLRMLPAPLAGCEKALIWSWDGSVIGSSNEQSEGDLVNGSILLYCLNSILKFSAVIVQPFSRYDLDGSGKVVTVDIPLPITNSNGSVAHVGDKLGLSAKEHLKLNDIVTALAQRIELRTVGYIRLLKLFKETKSDNFVPDQKYEWVPLTIEFGIPLFNPKLCNNICERIVTSGLLQADSLTQHHESMQRTHRKLREFCAEYQATGPAAKLLYLKDQQQMDGSKDSEYITNHPGSGKWNSMVNPSPISGASSEQQRLKLAHRHRSRTEFLSFDGSILRSYAVAPVEDPSQVTAPKVDLDESDSNEVILPGVNLIFDGAELNPFDIAASLQAGQPISLIAEAAAASTSFAFN
ncbi:protein FAM91A1-like [Hibiscus syriacus]|uniref:protein FAM91A1-like n=1 Tax=Hibiscus syriacus TaxID=106335 RepID=UPI0019216369|nr:protein FAM91A1-like [Hibiscus syriacus]